LEPKDEKPILIDVSELSWAELLDERQRKHVQFALIYKRDFAHGAPGNLDLLTIAALAEIIDKLVATRETDA
jgi:hypothetical protein